jgi:hypothetical protein
MPLGHVARDELAAVIELVIDGAGTTPADLTVRTLLRRMHAGPEAPEAEAPTITIK